jgi:hypothetical protein
MNNQLDQVKHCVWQLRNCIENVRWAVVEAKPEGIEHALADQFESTITDLADLLQQMETSLKTDAKVLVMQPVSCMQLLVRFNGRYNTSCQSYDAIAPLYALAEEQPNTWSAWVEGVLDALSPCPEQITALFEALIDCWQQVSMV